MRDHKKTNFCAQEPPSSSSEEEVKETDEIPEYWVEVMQSGYYHFMTDCGHHAWLIKHEGKAKAMLVDHGSRCSPEPIRYGGPAKELPADLEGIVTRMLTTSSTKPTLGLVQQEVAAIEEAEELGAKI